MENNLEMLDDLVNVGKRKLPVFLLLDTSGSMSGAKIESLNYAVKEMIDDFKLGDFSEIDLQVSIVTFGGTVSIAQPLLSVNEINYTDLIANGNTPMGEVLTVCRKIVEDKNQVTSNGYKPVIVLVSDGMPTDDYNKHLNEFLEGRTKKCDRWAMGIGQFNTKPLEEFLGDPEKQVFVASQAREISKFFKFVTMSTIQNSVSSNNNSATKDNLEDFLKSMGNVEDLF